MQTRYTIQITQLVEVELGLEVGDSGGTNAGTWYVHGGPDMLDVPLTCGYDFQRDNAKFELAGPAIDAALAWLRANLPAGWVRAGTAKGRVNCYVKYDDPAKARLFFTTVRYVLGPHQITRPDPAAREAAS
jgi:hypothetical protein